MSGHLPCHWLTTWVACAICQHLESCVTLSLCMLPVTHWHDCHFATCLYLSLVDTCHCNLRRTCQYVSSDTCQYVPIRHIDTCHSTPHLSLFYCTIYFYYCAYSCCINGQRGCKLTPLPLPLSHSFAFVTLTFTLRFGTCEWVFIVRVFWALNVLLKFCNLCLVWKLVIDIILSKIEFVLLAQI